MKIYFFNQETGKSVSAFSSDFILSRIIQTDRKLLRGLFTRKRRSADLRFLV